MKKDARGGASLFYEGEFALAGRSGDSRQAFAVVCGLGRTGLSGGFTLPYEKILDDHLPHVVAEREIRERVLDHLADVAVREMDLAEPFVLLDAVIVETRIDRSLRLRPKPLVRHGPVGHLSHEIEGRVAPHPAAFAAGTPRLQPPSYGQELEIERSVFVHDLGTVMGRISPENLWQPLCHVGTSQMIILVSMEQLLNILVNYGGVKSQ
jgi:hypothetical protein